MPRIRDDVSIRPFDALPGESRYLVTVDERHFVVNDAVAALLEGTREASSLESLARGVSGVLGRRVTPGQAGHVLREKIPDVIFEETPARGQRSPGGPLRFRTRLLSARVLEPLLALTSRLYAPSRVAALLSFFALFEILIALELWRAGMGALEGASALATASLVLLGVVVHEIGHLAACHRYGARHGGIGIGLYWFMPALYAEVHGAWQLERKQRAVVDIGGVYFQCLFLVLLSSWQLWRPSATVLLANLCTHFLMLNTLNPVLKFDGYWLLSDLSRTHNLHRRIREVARLAWRRLSGADVAMAPSPREALLLAAFLTMALAYFGYVAAFLAHHLAYLLVQSVTAWEEASWFYAASWLAGAVALGCASIGIASMLARGICEVTSRGTHESAAGQGNTRVEDVVA